MTAVAAPPLVLPEPVGLQYDWLDSPATRKVLRVGRRGTKTRFAFLAAMHGHGPGWEDGEPTHKGVLQGGDVVWIAQTYTNLTTVLWREEIEPRLGSLPFVSLDKTRHDVHLTGLGSLLLRSGEPDAIQSVRGVGKNLAGVIVDEAAWLALRSALQNVILPALLDNGGWLIIMSTTNVGPDGDYDDVGRPMVPSYFNQLCQQILDGQRGPEWVQFVGTAYDNPTIDASGIDELIAEYAAGSPSLEQEVYAKLLTSGLGLVLSELSEATHLVPRQEFPQTEWATFGAFDWGFHHPWSFGLYAIDDDGQIVKRETLTGRLDLPEDIDRKVREAGIDPGTFAVHGGGDCWRARRNTRASAGGNGPTVAEALRKLGWRLTPANDARVAGLNNFRAYIAVEDGTKPQFVWMDTPGNRLCLTQCRGMTPDPKKPEDALKIDADSAGRGGDDMYDETRYALMSRPIPVRKAKPVKDEKLPHRANPIVIENGVAKRTHRQPQTVGQLLERLEPKHVERLPVRRYG